MVIDRGVTGGTGQGAALPLGDVLQGAGVTVPLGQTKVDAVDEVAGTAASVGDEIGRLDVTVDEMAGVHQLDALQHLVGDHEDRLEGESAAALVELILEGRAEKVHHHEVVRVLGAKVVDLGEARGILQLTVHLVLVTQLRTASAMLFEFDSDLTLGGEGVEQKSQAHKVRHTKKREMIWTDRPDGRKTAQNVRNMFFRGISSDYPLVKNAIEIIHPVATAPRQEAESTTQSFSRQNLRRSNSDWGPWAVRGERRSRS